MKKAQMLKASATALVGLCLVGCNPLESEIDKCANAMVKAMEPYEDRQERAAHEADARLACLKAAAGKE